MDIKDKFAALCRRWALKLASLLRRWAFKLDHKRTEPRCGDGLYLPSLTSFGLAYYKLRRLQNAYRISRRELMEVQKCQLRGYIDAERRMRTECRERITASIVEGLIEHGVIKFIEKRDEETQELTISGSLYVGISDNEEETLFND